MIDDREIWACAQHLITHRGTAARAHAERRATDLGSSGDEAGRKTWLRILERIGQLEVTTPTGPRH